MEYGTDIKISNALQKPKYPVCDYPAPKLNMLDAGTLDGGCFADAKIFDAGTIQDHASFEKPQQYATGMLHVLVNGRQVIKDSEHTGALPGRVVRGPGWKGK